MLRIVYDSHPTWFRYMRNVHVASAKIAQNQHEKKQCRSVKWFRSKQMKIYWSKLRATICYEHNAAMLMDICSCYVDVGCLPLRIRYSSCFLFYTFLALALHTLESFMCFQPFKKKKRNLKTDVKILGCLYLLCVLFADNNRTSKIWSSFHSDCHQFSLNR